MKYGKWQCSWKERKKDDHITCRATANKVTEYLIFSQEEIPAFKKNISRDVHSTPVTFKCNII
jgi:hypothetical protein